MIHGSVAASCDHASEPFLDGTSRERFRFPGAGANADGPSPDDRFDSFLAVSNSFGVSRDWIENDNYISHVKMSSGALVFASNCGCVTSGSAKIPPAGSDRSGGIDWTGCGGFARSESVCAITRGTSKDSAGAESQPRRSAENSEYERNSVGWA